MNHFVKSMGEKATMLKIWGRSNSINVQKVLWCCAETGIPFERVDAGMQFGVNNTPEYKALNPNGLVPLIEDDGLVLWESHAIVRYLARKHGLGTLCPADPRMAADADRWMEWFSTTLWNHMKPIFWILIRTPPEKRNLTEVEDNRKKLIAYLAMADAHLAKNGYLTGEQFTMADIPLALLAHRWLNVPIERPALPHFERWFKTVAKRPGFQLYCAAPLT